jgi:hypothetical protein
MIENLLDPRKRGKEIPMKTRTLITVLGAATILGGCVQGSTSGTVSKAHVAPSNSATVSHGTAFMNGAVLGMNGAILPPNGLLFSKGEFYSNGTRISKGTSLTKSTTLNQCSDVNPNANRALALIAVASRPIAKKHTGSANDD